MPREKPLYRDTLESVRSRAALSFTPASCCLAPRRWPTFWAGHGCGSGSTTAASAI